MKHSVTKKTLPSGIELLLIDIPGVASFDMAIAFNAGYRFATKNNADIYEAPHVLEHIVFDGSKKYENSDALQDVFSRGGGYSNGITTMYQNIFPFHSRVTHAEAVLKAALDCVYFPLLKQQAFDEEIKVVENELGEYMGDLQLNAGQYTIQQILPDLQVSTDTQLARLGNVTLEDVKKYHKKYFGTNNTKILIATDLKKMPSSQIEAAISASVKGAPAGKRYALPSFEVAKAKPGTIQFVPIHKTTTDSTSAIHFAARKDKISRKEMHMLQLFSEMATGMKSFSVNYKLRKQGLIYGLALSAMESEEAYGLELSVIADNSRFVEVFAYTLESLRDFAKNGVTAEQFMTARKDYEDALDDALTSPDNIISWYIDDYLIDGTVVTVDEHREIIKKITQEQMLEQVRKLFNYDHLYATVFSSKGIRASAAMDLLAKEVLKKEKKVTTELIETNSIALTEKDGAYKFVVALLGAGVVAAFILPLVGLDPGKLTLSDSLAAFLGAGWTLAAAAVYVLIILASILLQQGKDLKVTMAQLAITPVSVVVIAAFIPGALLSYVASGDLFVRYHAWIVIGLATMFAFFAWISAAIAYRQARANH